MAGSGTAHLRPDENPLLTVTDVVVEFRTSSGQKVHAVSGVSLDVLRGETVGLVGESGCGKSSLGRAIMQLPPPQGGSVRLDIDELTQLRKKELRATRRHVQLVLQDPISSLNPRRRVLDIVAEGAKIWSLYPDDRAERAARMLEAVGLDPDVAGPMKPKQLSGGQAQRVCIARALMLEPALIICDEPVSALDVSIQAQILNLLNDAKERFDLSLIFIAHDLAVVSHVSDRVMVMYLGKLCEVLPSAQMHRGAAHPYTRLLLDSVPEFDHDSIAASGKAETIGEPPSPIDPPSGCRFRTRCPRADSLCADEEPSVREIAPGHFIACHHPHAVAASSAR